MMLFVVLTSLILIVLIAWYYLYYKYEIHLKAIPGPSIIPLLGNAWEFRNLPDLLNNLTRNVGEYGGIFKVKIGFGPPILIVTDHVAAEYILGSTKITEKSKEYEYLHSWLGSGLLTSSSAKWRKHRKMLTPAFHFNILKQFVAVFDSITDILLEKFRIEVGKGSVDIYPYITLCSLDIICASVMGTMVNAQENSDSDYVYSVKQMCRIVMERITSATKSNHVLYRFSKDYHKEKKALKTLHGYTNSVIASRKIELQADNITEAVTDDDVYFGKKPTFLDLLLQYKINGQNISDRDIREEVDTFMFEGHDTTASAISFTLYSLANNAHIQTKVYNELLSIFDNCTDINHKALQEMKYLEMVIKEALRLYPSVPVFGRNLHEDVQYDGITIPKNVTLSIYAYGLHRSPNIYPDPERFDPERFTAENCSKRSPYAYVPFSAGPRNCIGQKFAMLEMKFVIAKILRRFELLPALPQHKLHLVAETILKSSTGICIRLKNRKVD